MTDDNLSIQAINLALDGKWQKAAELNLAILKKEPNDLEALLRLAKAYQETGKITLAKRTFSNVLKIDKFNPIAKRNLIKFNGLRKLKKSRKISQSQENKFIKSDLFLEEPGKTKTVSLIKLAPPEFLLDLNIAEILKLIAGKHWISVRNQQNRYLGRLPDDLSQRLIKLIKGGNEYLAVVKDSDAKKLQIFIKEEKRSKLNQHTPSFPLSSEQYASFAPVEAVAF